MIEQLQMVLTTIGDLGEYSVWVVIAFFIWKLATLASILVVIRYAITKLHDLFVKMVGVERVTKHITEFNIREQLIQSDATPEEFLVLFSEIRKCCNDDRFSYIHKYHVKYALDAVKEKKERENNK